MKGCKRLLPILIAILISLSNAAWPSVSAPDGAIWYWKDVDARGLFELPGGHVADKLMEEGPPEGSEDSIVTLKPGERAWWYADKAAEEALTFPAGSWQANYWVKALDKGDKGKRIYTRLYYIDSEGNKFKQWEKRPAVSDPTNIEPIAVTKDHSSFTVPEGGRIAVEVYWVGSATGELEIHYNSDVHNSRLASPPGPTPTPTETSTPTVTPASTPTPTPTPIPFPLLISEVCYDGEISGDGDEFVEIFNPTTEVVPLSGYKIGDEETRGGGEGMYRFPDDTSIGPGEVLVVAKSAKGFHERFGFDPHFDFSGLPKYTAWASGDWALSNDGDEVLLLGPGDQIVDSVAYKSGNYDAVGVTGYISAPAPRSLQRVEDWDSNRMRADFAVAEPNPGQRTLMPTSPPVPSSPSFDGMHAYFGCLHSHSTYSDGSGPPRYAYAVGRANGLHFLALTDHSHMFSDEEWGDILAKADEATEDGAFVGLRGFEWTHKEIGHINVFGSEGYASRDDPNYDTLEEFYAWLAAQESAVAQFNHPFEESDLHDFAYNAAASEKICLLEVGNGSDPYYTFEEAYLRALYTGWHIGPANNGDTETPDWGADTPHRTGVLAPSLTKHDILEALRARRIFATEDANCALALRAGNAWMGSTVGTSTLNLQVYYHDGDGEGATLELFDRSLLVACPTISGSTWSVTVPAAPGHYYFAKAIQEDGDTAYTSPIWVEGEAMPEELLINEVLPAPRHVDWDGDGTVTPDDEWIELYNPGQTAIGLGGWQLDDEADGGSAPYAFALGTSIEPGGFLMFFKKDTGVAFDNDGDWVRLLRPDGGLADQFHYTRSPGYDKSWSRTESGDWTDSYPPSPGRRNKPPPKPKPPPPTPTPAPALSSIAEAKTLAKGTKVIVEGQVTVRPGLFGRKTIYIQDGTAGIMVYLSEGDYPELEEGDWVRIEGVVWEYKGEREIKVYGAAGVQRLGPGESVVPIPVKTGQVGEPLEGKLVQATGQITGFSDFRLDDGSGELKVYIYRGTGIRLEGLKVGQVVTVVGVVGQFGSTHELRPRSQADIQPMLLPATGAPPSLLFALLRTIFRAARAILMQ